MAYTPRQKRTMRAMRKSRVATLSENLVTQSREIAQLAGAELIRRLKDEETASTIKPFELNAIAGTAIDKVAKFERWGEAPQDSGEGWLNAFVKVLRENAGITLSLKVEPARDQIRDDAVTVDVLPLVDTPPPAVLEESL